MSNPLGPIPGSEPKAGARQHWVAPADPNQPVTVTLILRRRGDSRDTKEELLSGNFQRMPREQASESISADPKDMAAVMSFAQQRGLTVVKESPESRSVRLEGTVTQMQEAFGVQLGIFENAEGQQYLSHEGPIGVPQGLTGIVVAVLGLDEHPAAKHHSQSV